MREKLLPVKVGEDINVALFLHHWKKIAVVGN
jgi:hypothetical protein